VPLFPFSLFCSSFPAFSPSESLEQNTAVEGRKWHKDHFNCSHCNKSLADQSFLNNGTHLYCLEDYAELFSPRCSACGGVITEEYIEYIGMTWHKEHFCCTECGEALDGKVCLLALSCPFPSLYRLSVNKNRSLLRLRALPIALTITTSYLGMCAMYASL